MPELIDDPDDERLAPYRSLRDPARRMAMEAETGHFIAEGVTVVRRLLQASLTVRSVLVVEGKQQRIDDLLAAPVPLLVVSQSVMNTVAGFDLHRGVLACADRPAWVPLASLATTSRTIAVLEGVNDHENLGAIARSARALGVDAMLLDPTTADPWYRRAVRVSMGEMIHLPLARATGWPQALHDLREHGFVIAALTPSPDSVDLSSFAANRPERVAVLLGAEGPGLSGAAFDAADLRVRIPIRGSVDSLNVGHAAAIAFAALALPLTP